MNWTNEKPTKPGFYWWRQPGHDADKDKEIIELWDDGDVWKLNDDTAWKIDWLSGQFAGPIPEPDFIQSLRLKAEAELAESTYEDKQWASGYIQALNDLTDKSE